MMQKLVAILLAAGKSTRANTNKLLLPFRGSTVIENSLLNLLNAKIEHIIVVLGNEAEKVQSIINRFPVQVVINNQYEEGIGSSLRCGMENLPKDTTAVLIALADEPAVKSETITLLIKQSMKTKKNIIAPVYRGQHGHPVIFKSRYFPYLKKCAGDVGGKHIMYTFQDDIKWVEVKDPGVLFDIDTSQEVIEEVLD